MTTLPSATALAVLVVLSGIAGVVAADPTDVSTPAVTTTAVETDDPSPETDVRADASPETPPTDGATFEQRLAARLVQFDLTDGQIRTTVAEAVRLREAGASRLVIRSSVVMNLYSFGVDAPFLYAGSDATAGERLAERLGERFDLNDGQVAELAATVDRMRAAGADRAEIYRAVRALLVEYGVGEDELDDERRQFQHANAHRLHERAHQQHQQAHDRHERARRLHRAAGHDDRSTSNGDAVDRHVDRLQERYDLTDGQAAELERTIRRLLADGASRPEVRAVVHDRLAECGVEATTDRRTPADR